MSFHHSIQKMSLLRVEELSVDNQVKILLTYLFNVLFSITIKSVSYGRCMFTDRDFQWLNMVFCNDSTGWFEI